MFTGRRRDRSQFPFSVSVRPRAEGNGSRDADDEHGRRVSDEEIDPKRKVHPLDHVQQRVQAPSLERHPREAREEGEVEDHGRYLARHLHRPTRIHQPSEQPAGNGRNWVIRTGGIGKKRRSMTRNTRRYPRSNHMHSC